MRFKLFACNAEDAVDICLQELVLPNTNKAPLYSDTYPLYIQWVNYPFTLAH